MSSNIVDTPTPGNAENVTAPVESPLPEKLQGKSELELAQMYTELERKLGHQSNELGQLRNMLNESTSANAPPAEELNFYDDPEAAIEQRLAPLTQQITDLRVENTRQKLLNKHPDFEQTVAATAFQNWVAESPARVRMFQEANQGGFDSANELLTTWGQVNTASKQTETKAKEAVKRDRKIRAATTESGSANLPPGKTFNAADLRELRQKNPERYRAMEPQIRQAYAEGRVTR